MNKSESIKELATALNLAQAEMSGAKKSAINPHFKKSYADMGSVVEAVKGPFSNNGLSYSQFPIFRDGLVGVETILMHNSGEWISNELLLPMVKQDPQAAGSALTYARRYSLQAIAGIPSEDDDGNAASAPSSKQAAAEKPWYNSFNEHHQSMMDSIQAGKTPDQIIASISERYKVSNETKALIRGLA